MLTKRDGLRQKPELFFAQAFDAFLQARKNPIERTYRIGGFVVRVSFANESLLPTLTPALSHLQIESNETELKIHVWDSATTGTKMPAPFWPMKEIPSRGEIPGFADAGMFGAFQVDGNVLSMLDQADCGIYWTRDPRELPAYECGSPLKNILHWWMSRRARVFVHAGAVGIHNQAALLIGQSGSGKSTLALTCLRNGLKYLTDDYCLLGVEPNPTVYSIFNTAKLKDNNRQQFPFLTEFLAAPNSRWQDKSIYFIHSIFPDSMATKMPVRVVLLPRVTSKKTTVVKRAAPAEAMLAIAPSSLFQVPYPNQQSLTLMSTIVQSVPCYHLQLGRDLESVPDRIRELLAS